MPRSSRWVELRRRLADERGSASLEFLTVGVLLLVPMVYLVLALAQIQHAVLGLEGAARHAARTIAAADDHARGMAAADRSITVAAHDAGLRPTDIDVAITCSPDPRSCSTRGGTVTVQLGAAVPLPLAPPLLGLEGGFGVPVSARSEQPVSEFGSP